MPGLKTPARSSSTKALLAATASTAISNRPFRQKLVDTDPSGEGRGRVNLYSFLGWSTGPSCTNTQFKI